MSRGKARTPSPDDSFRLALDWGGGSLAMTEDSVLIGRDGGCDVCLPDPLVSRQHAEVYRVGTIWWVRDLGSTNGTFLDGEPIDAAPIVPFSTLSLGLCGPRLHFVVASGRHGPMACPRPT